MIDISTTITRVWNGMVNIADDAFHIEISIESEAPLQLVISSEEVPGLSDTFLIRVRLASPGRAGFQIEDLSFRWEVPATDMHGLYFGGDPRAELGYLPFRELRKDVAAHTGLPYMALVHRNGENRVAYGLLDQITETRMVASLSEMTRCYHITMAKPANRETVQQRIPVEGEWEEVFFFSRAREFWPKVLAKYAALVDEWTAQPAMPVPEHAFDPVFCTWTAIHHDVSHDWIMRNAPLAAELGFRTWLTDDGWFLEKGEFGIYEDVGEWLPFAGKFPDLKAHVEAVQALGFRYVLWVAPFMIGVNSAQAEAYKPLLTTGWGPERFHNLSPWHPETREVVTRLLTRLVRDYGLDGLKIDFIDAVSIHSQKTEGAADQTLGRSMYDTLVAGIDALLAENPGLLIEFRNKYTNLASRRYANLYRSSDVPINFTLNRWQTTLLRLLAPDRAAHMDPMLWHPADSDENVAVHLINGIASVPMVSIELDKYPVSHLELIRYWIGFYHTHRQTIVRGEFRPALQPTHIPLIDFVGENEVITGLYENVRVTRYEDCAVQWILNASTRHRVEFVKAPVAPAQVICRDKFGNQVYERFFDSHAMPLKLDVEIGGSLEFIIREH